MERKIVVYEKNQILNIEIQGDMDNLAMSVYKNEIIKLFNKQYYQKVIFDLKNVDFIDSSGIGLILGRYNQIKNYGGSMELKNVNNNVSKLLALTGIDRLVKVEMGV